jgi:hypothetical protein
VSVRLGAAVARDLLVGSRYWVVALAGALVVATRGAVERTSDATGADHTLLGLTLGLVVPLVCYGLFESVHRRRSTAELLACLTRHGADRHALATGALAVLAATSMLTTTVLAALAVLSSSHARPELTADVWAAAWGGALVGLGYAGLLSLGSRWGRAGRIWLLVLDWLFGMGRGLFAAPWVRGHARNLLGGAAVLDASPLLAAAVLVLLGALGLLLAARRGPS